MRITLLGTGAPLMPDRATTGMIVTAPGCEPLLIDTCGGFELARQVVAAGFRLTDIRNVVVTHRHMDHMGGMPALLLANQPLDVHASGDTHAGLAGLIAACFPEWSRHEGFSTAIVADGDVVEIGGFTVGFFAVVHRVPTLAVRVSLGSRTFAFSADSRPCDALVACARGADLFLCDAICAESDGATAAGRARDLMHPTAREAAQIASIAGAGRLALTHLGRFGTPHRVLEEAQATFAGEVSLPDDLGHYDV